MGLKPERVVVALVVVLLASASMAAPVVIDLAPEKAEFEAKSRARAFGVCFGVATLAGAGAAVYGYSLALDARQSVLLQTNPIDRSARATFLQQGSIGNGLAVTAIVVGVSFLIAAIIAFASSP